MTFKACVFFFEYSVYLHVLINDLYASYIVPQISADQICLSLRRGISHWNKFIHWSLQIL